MYNQINILAVRRIEGEPEERAAALARATEVAMVEARSRVRPPAPRVVGSYGELAQAEQVAGELAAAQFDPLLLPGDEVEDEDSRFAVRSFELLPGELHVATRSGSELVLRSEEARLLLRGTCVTRKTSVQTSKNRELSLGRAVMTGGLVFTKETRTQSTRVQEKTEGFVHVYASGHPTLVLRETEVLYQGLGQRMQPSRMANFLQLLQELRSWAPQAAYDDTLLRRAGQIHVLGGMLDPDAFIDVAIALLARNAGACG